MNDRYLYRAKRTDNHEWITWNILTGIPHDVSILEDTVCACTGLNDKNGKLIWENDIVELYDRNIDYKWRAVVLFGNPNCEYTWGWQLKPIGECEANTDILCWINMEESGAFCEVIGSAIDNPELLEVGE